MIRRRSSPWATLAFASVGLVSMDISTYASDMSDARARGAQVYSKYCALCHGEGGQGDGRAAGLQKKRPADLTQSRLSDGSRLEIVRRGGAAVNRSASMPAWGEVLTAQEIADVVVYLNVFAEADSRRTPKSAGSTARAAK